MYGPSCSPSPSSAAFHSECSTTKWFDDGGRLCAFSRTTARVSRYDPSTYGAFTPAEPRHLYLGGFRLSSSLASAVSQISCATAQRTQCHERLSSQFGANRTCLDGGR